MVKSTYDKQIETNNKHFVAPNDEGILSLNYRNFVYKLNDDEFGAFICHLQDKLLKS